MRLTLILTALLACVAGCPAPPAADPNDFVDVLVVGAGDATATSVVLWAKPVTPGPVTLRWRRADEAGWREVTLAFGGDGRPIRHMLTGLSPGSGYEYEVIVIDDERRGGVFRTPGAAGTGGGLRFGVTGDWRGELAPYAAVANIPDARLDFLVLLGDTVYADVASPALARDARSLDDFRRKHAEPLAERFGHATWADVRASTALYATIDDHELTNDFAGAGAPPAGLQNPTDPVALVNQTDIYAAALQAFEEFHPLAGERYPADAEERFAGRPRLYRYRRFGDVAALFVLDARSFRDPPVTVGPLDPAAFLTAAFEPGRTMLGRLQLEDLKRDLLDAQAGGVTWKFVCVPEPIQNLGPILAEDRFEGYAAERAELLGFIDEQGVTNVVFIAADIHGTIVNELSYQRALGGPQLPVAAWEITTGSVAYDAPFGPTTAAVGALVPVIGPPFVLGYVPSTRTGRDVLIGSIISDIVTLGGYDPVGLQRAPATLLAGEWVALHTYGWTQFDIDAETRDLRVTTWGIDAYDEATLLRDPAAVAVRTPAPVSVFEVRPISP